eukprot:9292968-Alexandrium_andersonii.AAC.1
MPCGAGGRTPATGWNPHWPVLAAYGAPVWILLVASRSAPRASYVFGSAARTPCHGTLPVAVRLQAFIMHAVAAGEEIARSVRHRVPAGSAIT